MLKSKQDNFVWGWVSELNNIFYVKDLKRITFYVKLIDDWRKT